MHLLKPLLPHFIAIAAFFAVIFVYFQPAFEGKRLPQNDVLQGVSAGKQAWDYQEKTGEQALWTTSMFSGMPAYIVQISFSGDVVMKIHRFIRTLVPHTVDVIFVNFIGMYIMLVCFRISPYLAFLGGFAYAFSTFTIISAEAGHLFKVFAMGYFPIIVGGVKLVFDNKYFKGAVLTAVGIGLELAAQHYQITYYAAILIFILSTTYLVFSIREKQLKSFVIGAGILVFAVILGVGPSAGRLWTTFEYNEFSIRGKKELTPAPDASQVKNGLDRDYAFAWSQGIWETMTYVLPNLYGGASGEELDKNSNTYKALQKNGVPLQNIKGFTKNVPTYWGDQPFTSGPMYAGIVVLGLALLGFYTIDIREKIWLSATIALLTCIAWGRNFETLNFFLFDYFPMYNKFRTVSMALSIVSFSLIVLAVLGVHNFLSLEAKRQVDVLKKAGITLLSLIAFTYLVSLFMNFEGPKDADYKLPDWLLDAIIDDRKAMLHGSMFRSLGFSIACLATLYLYVTKKLSTINLTIALSVLAIVDLWTIDKKYLSDSDFKRAKEATEVPLTQADKIILQDTSYYRVFDLNNPFNNAHTSYYHNSIGGYSGVKMQRYQDLIERHLSKNNQAVLDMLNAKYIITNQVENPVFPRQTALGNAWLVEIIKTVASADEEIAALNAFDPRKECVIDQSKYNVEKTSYSKEGVISLVKNDPKHLIYDVNAVNTAFAVFSEIHYPKGWNAYIDGNPVNHKRCNYVLRGLEIPAGQHKVEFKFEPVAYYKGNQISFIFSIILVAAILGVIILETIGIIKMTKATA